MTDQHHPKHTIRINRAPVLTLWAAVVAACLGFAWEEALTLGRAVAGLNAYAKGKALGLFTGFVARIAQALPCLLTTAVSRLDVIEDDSTPASD
jgi:hypothetical protein